ncbi:MAG: Sensor histidine kinase TmoS [Bacteroidetes bacterium ADurb.BinA395]|nr:MAG: Sensor histidine kinase TmoS [Bacteroidetes bacterium ADurb.BinA395]HOF99121.1 substrate-binding domain-containing protein [Paludibacteraceae bacterium]HOR39685.1 substrate-binding domain-containing protein [Paludibacteraceae bacterium]HPL76838.1 substrate-binding domain-containing protein [Paludibacteraceae bacterium]HRT78451.1 substrate-binding domain-containing protein [Paludibacteraceae bacterium]
MKKAFLFNLIVLLFFLPSKALPIKKEFLIGVSQCSDDAWRRTMNEEILREASFYPNLKVKIKTAFDSNQKQIRDIESFIEDKVDILIVAPNEAIPLTPVIENAMKCSIPVILVDRKINSDNYTAFVGADNYQIGKEVGIYVANLLKRKGNIVEITGLKGSTPAVERHKGFRSVIDNYPQIKIVYENDGGWLRDEAREKMKNAIRLNIPIDLVFAHNDEMATGVYEAYQVYNEKEKPKIIGIDALPGTNGGIQKVLDGILDATFIYPTGGEKAVQIAVRILRHEPYDKENILYTAVVDKTNARVIKLQTDQIIQHQNRIAQLNQVLNKNLSQYSTQRIFLVLSLTVLFVILLLLALLFKSYKHKNKVNRELEIRNAAINRQKEELAEQRDQLLMLSKNLEEATQAKLVFFTNISHEFKTPLTLILGPLDRLQEKENLSEEGKQLILLMRKNVHLLLKLIDQIIDFRKTETGKMQMTFTFGDLKLFISDICQSFRFLAQKKHIHFNFFSDGDDFVLWFDSDKMEKICYNLISNAFKFTPENGKIEVKLSKYALNDEFFAKIIVSDSGIGIPNSQLDKIFNRFFKIGNNTQNSGIGLHLTKMLVELHNGIIEVQSVEGKGSTFTVTIPFKQKDIAMSEQYPDINFERNYQEKINYMDVSDEINDEYNAEKPLILLVDDNADVRNFIKTLLQNEYTLIEAKDGQSGLLKAMKYVPDLIVSDVMMDKMNGFELCKAVKENISTSHIPVILLTAYAMDEQRSLGFESGADAYIPKPFNENLLKIRIRKTIENRKKLKEYFQNHLAFGDKKELLNEVDNNFLERFRRIIEENLMDTELNIDDIGKSMGLSRVQLYRKVKSLTNYSPNEFIRIIRLKTAEQMMITGEKSISEIAYDTGFTSPSYFTKCFKEYFNENPTDFLKRIKN